MIVASIGSARRFDDLQKGEAFFFADGGKKYAGIKVIAGTETGAVVIAPNHPVFTRGPEFLGARVFNGLVFSIPELRFVLSPDPDDISTGHGYNPEVGKVYVFGLDQEFLLFRYTNVVPGNDVLLSIRSGDVADFSVFKDSPVVISRWAIVIDLWDKPRTLFTYPATAQPLTFS